MKLNIQTLTITILTKMRIQKIKLKIIKITNTKVSPDYSKSINKFIYKKTNSIKLAKKGLMRKNTNITEKQTNNKPNIKKKSQRSSSIHKSKKIIKKRRSTLINIDPNDEKNIIEYLSTDVDDLEYDDALKRDSRSFCEFFHDRIIDNVVIVNTFYSDNSLKPRSIKIILFLINIDLYFVVNGLLFNEDYVSEVYHLETTDGFFTFLPRSIDRFVSTSMVGIIFGYIIECFVFDEGKLKRTYRREKDDVMSLRYEVSLIIKSIKSRYNALIIACYLITVFSWYYITCFNNVYPHMVVEWIKSSIVIFLIMQIIDLLLVLLEGTLRVISFHCKSEKVFKVSKMLS